MSDPPDMLSMWLRSCDGMLAVKFNEHGQIYYFSCDDPETGPGDRVIVETGQGLAFGLVMARVQAPPPDISEEDARPVLRRATEQDLAAQEENRAFATEAYRFCDACIRERGLEMKLVDVEVLFDRSKILFYFTAPTRIDFRELVKDLVREYHTRIELRQIGVRHETQMLGAMGSCGMVCCCRRFLHKFVPVTIKMAKEQNLFLNPSKISGVCGRLLCCLSYEQENYDSFHRNCPRLGKRYQTSKGLMKVMRANLFRNSVVLLTEAGEEVEMTLEEWSDLDPRRPDVPGSSRGDCATVHSDEQDMKNIGEENVLSLKPHGVSPDLRPRRLRESPEEMQELDGLFDSLADDDFFITLPERHPGIKALSSATTLPASNGQGGADGGRRRRRRKK